MYAGAVRETVFSRPELIRRVNADFVPVFVSPPNSSIMQSGDEEGRLFQTIYRSRVEGQGICVLNTGGQVLHWVLMFDDAKSILGFLDHSLKRFREHPDAKQPIMTERYGRFPSGRMEDFKEEAKPALTSERHRAGARCPAKSRLSQGAFTAQVFGRALDANGRLFADTVKQEYYAQDRFTVTPEMQAALAKAFAETGTRRVRISDELARLCVMHAYLGQTDVRPLANPLGGRSDLKQCEFWAQRVGEGSAPALLRVEGTSEVVVESADSGHDFRHEITLTWEGFIEMDGKRMTRLLLSGRGTEKLKWGSEALKVLAASRNAVSYLVAGHPIYLACEVRYGILGEAIRRVPQAVDGAIRE